MSLKESAVCRNYVEDSLHQREDAGEITTNDVRRILQRYDEKALELKEKFDSRELKVYEYHQKLLALSEEYAKFKFSAAEKYYAPQTRITIPKKKPTLLERIFGKK
jgi:hypothetical protein